MDEKLLIDGWKHTEPTEVFDVGRPRHRLQTRTLAGRWVTIADGGPDVLDALRGACSKVQSAALYCRIIDETGAIIVAEDASDELLAET